MTPTVCRQKVRAGSIFNFDKIEVDSCTPPVDSDFEPNVKRQSTVKGRIRVQINYDDVFGDLSDDVSYYNQNLQLAKIVPANLPSPKYEQTVHGLTNDSLEYFPPRRRGCHRVTDNIIRNLTSEFDRLADDTKVEGQIEDKKFLRVPIYSFCQNHENTLNKVKNKFTSEYEKGDSNVEQCLRRKPIFKKEVEAKEGNCSIC